MKISPDLKRASCRPGPGLFFAALLLFSPALAEKSSAQSGNLATAAQNNYQNSQNHLIFQRLNSADEFIKAGKLVHARLLLEKLIPLDPNPYSAQTHELLGQVSFQLGNNQEAIANYLQALKYDSRSLPSHWNLALAYMQENNYDQAIVWAKKTLSRNPSASMRQQINRFLSEMEEKKQGQSRESASAPEPDYLNSLISSRQANRWPSDRLPLKYFIHRTAMENMQGHYPDLFKSCLNKWQEASANHLAFLEVDSPQNADIELRFTNDLKQVATQEGAAPVEQGIARTSVYESGTTFNTIDKSIITILLIRPFSKAPLNDDQMKETMLHELGHSLGLGGHSPHASDIMNFSQNFKQLPALTKRDKRTMARLYESYPALAPGLPYQASAATGSLYNTSSSYFSPAQNPAPGFNNYSPGGPSPQPLFSPDKQPALLNYP